MPGIYERLGLRPIINARGTHTRLGGTLMPPEVLDAMREAAGAYVVLEELQAKASEVIARPNSIVVNTHTMQPGEERVVAEVLRAAIEARWHGRVAAAGH